MEPNQIDVVTSTVFRGLEQVVHAGKARLTRQVMRNLRQTDGHDRIHHDLSFVHAVTTADLDVGPGPDADAAPDPPASNAVAKVFGEHHDLPRGDAAFLGVVEQDVEVAGRKAKLSQQQRHLPAVVNTVSGGVLHQLSQRHRD